MRPEQEKGPQRPRFHQKLLQPTASVVFSIAALAPSPKDPMVTQAGFEPILTASHTTAFETKSQAEFKLGDLNHKVFVVQIASDKQPESFHINIAQVNADSAQEEPVQNAPVIAQALPEATDTEDSVWYELENCESSHNPQAVDPSQTYFGLYQFDDPTWQSEGGTGHASDAPPEEQLMRAKSLQKKNGWNPWPACARKLGLLK